VIESFAHFLIGGNFAVGIIVFAILTVINFIVVTKGAGRIAEVSARFALDAMPGKQMAIDADLNAGLIDQVEAKRRRTEVSQEAEFYGSMDGASKFVRGDAIAGIMILFINVIGGLAIGMLAAQSVVRAGRQQLRADGHRRRARRADPVAGDLGRRGSRRVACRRSRTTSVHSWPSNCSPFLAPSD
jgi:flagellar biosynthesis component FlhA